jgi:hypothetical protein
VRHPLFSGRARGQIKFIFDPSKSTQPMSLSALSERSLITQTENKFVHADGAEQRGQREQKRVLFFSLVIYQASRTHHREQERSEPDKTLKAAARQDNPVYISLQFKRTKYIQRGRAGRGHLFLLLNKNMHRQYI